MSGSFGDMGNLLKQAQKMQAEIDRMESELAETTLQGVAGGGAVRVTATGDGQVKNIDIAEEMLSTGDKSLIEQTVTAAVRDALGKAQDLKKDRYQRAMGGLNLPGMF